MRRATRIIIAVTALLGLGLLVGIMIERREAEREALAAPAPVPQAVALRPIKGTGQSPAPLPSSRPDRSRRPGPGQTAPSANKVRRKRSTDRPAAGTASAPTSADQPMAPTAPALQNPGARDALALVGLDPAAEQYWAAAINDPSLPPKERKDLIEDLNEEGFADPKNLTVDDLPLIQRRLALIELHMPAAMDEINAAAFAEAYKDLKKMYDRLTQ